MALQYGTKITTMIFQNMSGGINTTDPPTNIGKNQVQSALNAVFFKYRIMGKCAEWLV